MKKTFFLALLWMMATSLFAINKTAMSDTLTAYTNNIAKIGRVKVTRVVQKNQRVEVYASKNLADFPVDANSLKDMQQTMSEMVLGNKKGKVLIFAGGYELSELVHGASKARFTHDEVTPLVQNSERAYNANKGLDGRHIAMYGSHGIYYNQKLDLWKWQRAKILTTVEDLYTTSYTMPFLVPMLENAGAVVIQPRERDTNTSERLADDQLIALPAGWQRTQTNGFGIPMQPLTEGQNPFEMGGYSFTKGTTPLQYSLSMLEEGEYAVYVSYKSFKQSTDKAIYKVTHKGVTTTFTVNQKMGGGTWVYLGTFALGPNKLENYLTVSQEKGDAILSSDCVKIGGGMGSVARYRSLNAADNVRSSDDAGIQAMLQKPKEELSHEDSVYYDNIARQSAYTSGYPRWIEGSRYWFQYAGIPDSVYNFTESKNDYTDDYASRGRWANYLAGGSSVYPDGPGLNIPIDLFLAFHSDAGVRLGDTIIGTLIIYTDYDDEKKRTYENGTSRLAARDYADCMQSQIVNDMRALYAPEWQRRQLQNSSYAEARNPKMPAVLLELLSHQNFADMRYGLDPRVRFDISRAIYKGMLRFLAEQYKTDYVVQPLPVKDFAIRYNKNQLQLSWEATTDPLEPTAKPTGYVLYTKTNDSDWDNGKLINGNSYSFTPEDGVRYDFRVHAVNKGGQSMPSEELSACIFTDSKEMALVVNGFTRVGAPDSYATETHAGFLADSYGVPYKKDVCYIGAQYEFRRDIPWQSDDNTGAGGCYGDQATTVMAGNMFDYPIRHGKVLQDMGISYVSTSMSALKAIDKKYTLVDIILGKQKETVLGIEKQIIDFKTFTKDQQSIIRNYVADGGRLLVSGAYIGGDLVADNTDRQFMREVLHVDFATSHATISGVIMTRQPFVSTVQLQVTPDTNLTVSENPDGLDAYGEGAVSIGRFFDTQVSIGATWQNLDDNNTARTMVYAFPLESTHDFPTIYRQSISWLIK